MDPVKRFAELLKQALKESAELRRQLQDHIMADTLDKVAMSVDDALYEWKRQ